MPIKRLLQRISEGIDRRYLKKTGATTVPGSSLELLLICYHPYQAKQAVHLNDDTTILPGDMVGEFHMANQRVIKMGQTVERGLQWRLIELFKEEFSLLAEACVSGKIPLSVKGFYGVNVLPAGARRLGFTLVPIAPGWERWWLGFWESALRWVNYSFKSKKGPSLKKTMDPYQIWMTRQDLLRMYGKKE